MGRKLLQKQFENCEGQTVTFTINKFGARKAAKYLSKIIKIKSSIAKSIDVKKKDQSKKWSLDNADINFGDLIGTICESISDDSVFELAVDMFNQGSKIDSYDLTNNEDFDDCFSGDMPLMLECIAFMLYENYGNIFKKKLFSNLANTMNLNFLLKE